MSRTPLRPVPPIVATLLAAGTFGCSPGPVQVHDMGAPIDVELTPPPPGQGFQLGTPSFQVAAGTEEQDCYFFAVPGSGTDKVYVNHFTIAQNPGSHHMNIFRVKTVLALGGKPGDVVKNGQCFISGNWSDWPLVVNSQSSTPGNNTVDWQLPDGVAQSFQPGELLMLQTHYVNATTQMTPGTGKALVNFFTTTADKVKYEMGTAFATNQSIRVCPGQGVQTFQANCRFALGGPVTVMGATGHFHSRGKEFQIRTFDPVQGAGQMFYDSTEWNDPPFDHSLNVAIPQNGGVSYTCKFEAPAGSCGNAMDGCCYTFGPHVETQEHCNAFVYYYPKMGTDVNCF